MKFFISECTNIPLGKVAYIDEDNAFNTIPICWSDYSVLVGNIEVGFAEFANNTRVNRIVGYHLHPIMFSIKKKLAVPTHNVGYLIIEGNIYEDDCAISFRLEGSLCWPTFYDPLTGWVCIGDDVHNSNDQAVKFLENALIVL